MKLIKQIKSLFLLPTPNVVAARDLAQAQLDLLAAEAQKEYYTANVALYKARIERLKSHVQNNVT